MPEELPEPSAQGGDEVPPPVPILAYRAAVPGNRAIADGNILVVPDGFVLPSRCVKCNASDDVKLIRRKFRWLPGWWALLLFCTPLGVLFYVIVAAVMTKRATVTYGLCARHRMRRVQVIAWCWLCAAAGIALFVAGVMEDVGLGAAIGALAIVGALIVGFVAAPTLTPVRIADGVVRLRGAGPDFLASL